MEIPTLFLLSVTPIYIALLGLLFLPFTLRVGFYRVKNQINLGDGGDADMIKRIRGQGNFVETVPLALVLLLAMELMGASDIWLHALGATLVIGRLLHYLSITELAPFVGRPIGMFATLGIYIIAPIWILVDLFF